MYRYSVKASRRWGNADTQGDDVVLLWNLSAAFCLGSNRPWFMEFSGRPRNPRGYTSHLRVQMDTPPVEYATYKTYTPPAFCLL